MTLTQYLEKIATEYKSGSATEHSYRSHLKDLVEHTLPGVNAINEPKRIAAGAPDYVLTRNNIPVGFIEAKDLGDALDKTAKSSQLQRYRESLDNLILTDYVRFLFFRNNQLIEDIRLADVDAKGRLVFKEDVWQKFITLLQNFGSFTGQTIKSAEKLAQMMAAKARLLQEILYNALETEDEQNRSLQEQYEAFQDTLLKDITHAEFADLYAQTIAYGMFAARLHDDTIDNFSRQEAANLIPKSNPFLRQLFHYVAGYDIDTRIEWIVDELATVFLHTNVKELLQDFGKTTQRNDPVIHFYETFLAEYNPKLRKSRGVYYTPEPIVNFIVRAVDDLLKTEFNLKDGLADTSKVEIETVAQGTDRRRADNQKRGKELVHRVQVLDPATGTGTFLSEVIKHLYNTRFSSMPGIWSDYVERDLLPRLHGFELLMASYAMCHLKLDLLLRDTGYQPKDPTKRLKVYLTNSLEKHDKDYHSLFASFIADESRQASKVKREMPIMVVIGNPPYSGHSANNGAWIENLLSAYKQEPGGGKLQEKNPKWLNDDYVKFIRYGEHFVEKNGEGILAFITNHSYLDNPTFRGMRWHLLQTFDKIYILDLHGNAKKKETAPDGSADQNVFDIQQGVAIILAIKTKAQKEKEKNALADIFAIDLYGKRENKYEYFWNHPLAKVDFQKIQPQKPHYFFVGKDFDVQKEYEQGLIIPELFKTNSVGIVTSRDEFVIDSDSTILSNRIQDFLKIENPVEAKDKYALNENQSWKISEVKKKAIFDNNFIQPFSYRPFDNRFLYYDNVFIERSRREVMRNFLDKDNLGIVVGRQGQVVGDMQWNLVFITNQITDFNLYYRGGGMTFPLYLYPTPSALDPTPARVPNLDRALVEDFARRIGLAYAPDAAAFSDVITSSDYIASEPNNSLQARYSVAPEDLLRYIYAVLHHPGYRERYKEFLKIDFPRIPYPADAAAFWALAAIGKELVSLHLLEHPALDDTRHRYLGRGENEVAKGYPQFASPASNSLEASHSVDSGKVYINDTQYFDAVPAAVWNFYIGGYQPAQKWLKDRRGRALSYDDIRHYLRVLVALAETERFMQTLAALPYGTAS